MTRADRPFVIANFAMTIDGKISTRNQTPAQFTSANDKRRFLEIRAMGDAVIAGRRTVEKDTMSMGIPGVAPDRSPLRVLISESGKISPEWKVFHSVGGAIVIFSTPAMKLATQQALRQHPQVTLHLTKKVNLARVLRVLQKKHHVRKLVCEGGAGLFRSFLDLDAIDQLHLTLAPKLFGGTQAPTLTGVSDHFLKRLQSFRLAKIHVIESECFLTYRKIV